MISPSILGIVSVGWDWRLSMRPVLRSVQRIAQEESLYPPAAKTSLSPEMIGYWKYSCPGSAMDSGLALTVNGDASIFTMSAALVVNPSLTTSSKTYMPGSLHSKYAVP